MSFKKKVVFAMLIVVAAFLTYCRKEKSEKVAKDTAEVPYIPENIEPFPVTGHSQLATLGRVLFYDKELSQNKNVSCGSCHKQENAFTDNLQFSVGTANGLTERNTPSVFAKNGRLFWDGRANSLQDLALRPVRNPVEMNHQNITALVKRISEIDYYQRLFTRAYGADVRIDSNMIKAALSEFIRSFSFTNNKFSQSRSGNAQLTASEERGRELFFGDARCSQCHHITDDGFSGGGNGYGITDESHNIGLDRVNTDRGVAAVTGQPHDEGAFMMPVLLNCELTAPYMHDGRFKTLEEVVEHYNSEIQDNPNLDFRLRDYDKPLKLNLSDQDKKALVDFLKTLTDPSILTDQRFSNPFKPRTS